MLLYNSLTRSRDEFKPREEGKVTIYTCGPTVYHFAHIGNLRTYIMEDVLEKYLRFAGYDVKRVMNITDVGHLTSDGDTGEDKMLKGAKREHKTVLQIAQFYTDAFFADCKKLNIKRPDVVEPATACVPEFISMIETLLEKGYAYEAGGNIYFDTAKLYKLSSKRSMAFGRWHLIWSFFLLACCPSPCCFPRAAVSFCRFLSEHNMSHYIQATTKMMNN